MCLKRWNKLIVNLLRLSTVRRWWSAVGAYLKFVKERGTHIHDDDDDAIQYGSRT